MRNGFDSKSEIFGVNVDRIIEGIDNMQRKTAQFWKTYENTETFMFKLGHKRTILHLVDK